jgi:hypothetical protein
MSVTKINQALTKLEDLIRQKSYANDESLLVKQLQEENQMLKKEYQQLKDTSQEVINELNNSIQIIEDYFKKQNANSQNT